MQKTLAQVILFCHQVVHVSSILTKFLFMATRWKEKEATNGNQLYLDDIWPLHAISSECAQRYGALNERTEFTDLTKLNCRVTIKTKYKYYFAHALV